MQNELLTEHLGFAPVHFVDQVLEIVNRITYKCLSQLETVLQTELGALECEKGMAAIETLFENALDTRFDRFEVYVLGSVLTIPTGLPVVLDHYKDLDFTALPQEEQSLDEEIDMLRKKVLAQRYISTKLNERKLKFQESLAKLQVFKATLKELEKRAMEKDMHPLSESALSIHTMLHQAQDKVLEISARTSQVDWARVAMIGATNSKALVFDAEADIAMHMKMKLAHDENTAHSNVSAWHISKNISQARKIGSVADLKDVVAKLE